MKQPPSPPKSIITGHLKGFKQDPIGFMRQSAEEYGPIVLFQIFNKKVYFINHPDYVKQVLQTDHKNYHKSPGYRPLRRLGGMGIFTSDGEQWLHQRKLYQPALTHTAIESYADIVIRQTNDMMDQWAKKTQSGQPVNISRAMMGVTLGILSESLFSYKIKHDSKIYEALTYALQWINRRIMKAPFNWPAKFPTSGNRRFFKAVKSLDEVVYGAIEQKQSKGMNNDLLSRFMNPEGTIEPLKAKALRDEVMTIFIAGHETSANVLMWTFYEIARHPEIQQKIKKEIQTLGRDELSFQDLHNLKDTTQVIEEAMRLYPPVWHLGRMNLKATQIGGYDIPAKSHIRMSPLVMHRSADYFKHPDQFNPDRFQDNDKSPINPFLYIPFGAGPRLCAGRNFAMMEMVLIVAKVMAKYEFDVPEEIHKLAPLMTLRPTKDIYVKVKK